jgi:hypothetical protein
MRVWLCLLGVLMMLAPCRAYGPDESKWLITYTIPEDIKAISAKLSYCFWDPKIDGDASTKKVLLTTTAVKLDPGLKTIPIQVLLNGGKSVVIVGKQLFRGKGILLDPSFARATEPKTNYDGYYVLAQKPVDAKNPAKLGDTQDAAAWIELGIEPKP